MTGYELYCLYLACYKHFYSSYDFFKYHGKIKASVAAFEKRREVRSYHYLAKRLENPTNFMVANLVAGKKWFPDFREDVYVAGKKRIESLGYLFKDDLSRLNPDFDKNFVAENNQTPLVIQAFVRKEITPETYTILLDIMNATGYYSSILKDDVLWDEGRLPLKYLPFLKTTGYEKSRFKKIVLEQFGEKND